MREKLKGEKITPGGYRSRNFGSIYGAGEDIHIPRGSKELFHNLDTSFSSMESWSSSAAEDKEKMRRKTSSLRNSSGRLASLRLSWTHLKNNLDLAVRGKTLCIDGQDNTILTGRQTKLFRSTPLLRCISSRSLTPIALELMGEINKEYTKIPFYGSGRITRQ